MDDDVDAAEAITNRVDHDRAAFGGGDVRRDEQIVGEPGGCSSSGGEDPRTGLAQPRDHRLADPLGTARDERPAAIQLEPVAHDENPPSSSSRDAVRGIVVTRPSCHTSTVWAIPTKSPVPTTPGIDLSLPSSCVASAMGPTAQS